MKKVINVFQFLTITAAFIIILIFLVPRFFGINPFIVLSGSMEEEIKTGSIAYVNTNIKREDIKVGDIIAFSLGDTQVTHRVVSINDDNTFTTKGDANETVDLNNVKFENYKGKTIFSIPYLGYALKLVQTKIGYCIIVILVALNLIVLVLSKDDNKNINRNKNQREDNNEKE